jgi:hypothetical protein
VVSRRFSPPYSVVLVFFGRPLLSEMDIKAQFFGVPFLGSEQILRLEKGANMRTLSRLLSDRSDGTNLDSKQVPPVELRYRSLPE